MSIPESIVANDFMFCADHGFEWCHYCCVDYRMGNNISIEDELHALLETLGDDTYDPSDRPSIELFPLVRFPLGEPLNADTPIACDQHNQVNCKTCFNWFKMVSDIIQM
ncbi:hypothetical protein DFH28DRAFT_882447 [Melampsora americana]|nr:hypothetical protein DFH28DRAFT_882447 [Melampsora americana]